MKPLVTAYTIAALLGAGYFLVDGAGPNVVKPMNEESGDGTVDLAGAHAWAMGDDPYSDEWLKKAHMSSFGHPPTTPFWFLFFGTWYPRPVHGMVGLITLAMLAGLLLLLAVELKAPVIPATVALVFGFVIDQSWMGYHLAMMQLGTFIALLYALAWWFLRRGRQVEGGVMLGLACTLKLFPGLMMLFLLATRRFKAVLAGGVAWLAIACVMAWGYHGFRCWPEFFSKQGGIADYWMANVKNGSVQGIVLRLFFPGCQPHFGRLPAATLIASAISLALVLGSWWLSRRLARDDRHLDAPFALFTLVSVFTNPWIWEHYYVLVIFPWALALSLLWREPLARWQRGLGLVALGAVVWLLSLDIYIKTSPGRLPNWHLRMHLYEVANWLMWPILIALLGALVFAQDRRRFSPRMGVS